MCVRVDVCAARARARCVRMLRTVKIRDLLKMTSYFVSYLRRAIVNSNIKLILNVRFISSLAGVSVEICSLPARVEVTALDG